MTEILPAGWSEVLIEDVVLFNPKHSGTLNQDQDVSFVPMSDVSEDSGTVSARQARKLREVWKGYTHFADGDVLVAKITPCMENGKAAIARDLLNGIGCGSTEFHVLRPAGSILSEYLWYFVRQRRFRDDAAQVMTGAVGQRRVPAQYLRSFPIPLPPMGEQRRIVARIEALFARIRRARANLERVAPLAGRYFSATLVQAFQGNLTDTWRTTNGHTEVHRWVGHSKGPYEVPEGWAWRPLPSMGELARGKSRHRPRNYPALYDGPYPFIQTGDVRAARGRLRSFHQTYSEAGLAQSRLWPRDTLCITIAANIAETAILDIEACFPDSVVGFRAMRGLCLPEYVEYFFRTAKEDLAAFAPATAQKNINLETLEAVLVPTPGLPEQAECVSRLSRSEAAARVCEDEASRALALLHRLEQGILARAFRGELVPQDLSEATVSAQAAAVDAEQPARAHRSRAA